MRASSTLAIGLASFALAVTAAVALHRWQPQIFSAGVDRDAASLAHQISNPARSSESDGSPWGGDYVPNVPVVGHDGKTYRFYDDLVRGKMVVISFIYTSCANVCPLATARLAMVKDQFGERVGKDIFFLSISIDPARDGPEVIKKYAETYGGGDGWLFLTGEQANIDLIRHRLGERSRSLNEHRSDVILGNDVTKNWGKNSLFSDTSVIVNAILEMDPKFDDVRKKISNLDKANVLYDLSKTPGKGLYIKACSSCHSIGYGNIIGPDLAGVTKRRERAWLKRFLIEPDVMRAEGDKIALEVSEKFKGVDMPALGLSENDAEDLITYLSSVENQQQELAERYKGPMTEELRETLSRPMPPGMMH
ncbi:MAG: SCO family protein [Hyphomicrobium sp.]|nr:SCO family protein [Hyphomicrobium sp.]